mmetsp:Transcript_26019/g.22292  ORF Transcript_26019/g.22292 Transcript_26019/m.22292 type:complete len:102 (-) Transcript_26019:8-313(-)
MATSRYSLCGISSPCRADLKYSGFIGFAIASPQKSMQDNKFTSFFAVYFIGSTLQGILMNTGAFEIYKGNTLIWSTLQAGRLPKLNDIVMAFQRQGVDFAF